MIDYSDCRGRAAMCYDLADRALSETNKWTWKMLAECWLLLNSIEELVERVLAATNEELSRQNTGFDSKRPRMRPPLLKYRDEEI